MDFKNHLEKYTLEQLQSGVVFSVYKPLHFTSYEVVSVMKHRIKKHYDISKIKIGHAGTLDPLAEGLMVVSVGKATKQIETIQSFSKKYIASIQLGYSSLSYDLEQFPQKENTLIDFSLEQIKDILSQHFIGMVTQTPPHFSAVKVDGKRAYKMARENQCFEIKSKEIQIHNWHILEWVDQELTIEIEVSKGTYIRSIASDIGKKLNSQALLTKLIRVSVGEYSIYEKELVNDLDLYKAPRKNHYFHKNL